MRKFNALFYARTMEFLRDRGALFWNILFPVVLVVGFAFVFSNGEDSVFTVGLLGEGEAPESLRDLAGIEFVRYDNAEELQLEAVTTRLRQHQLDMVIDLDRAEYYLNSEAPGAEMLRRLIENKQPASGSEPASTAAHGFQERRVAGAPIRYVDWVVPGVIGMNMMFSCLFGVGYVMVRYRKNNVLKRLKATPVSAFVFVSAQGASRLVIVLVTSIFVFAGTNAVFRFTMNGSYFTLLLLTVIAIVCMIGIGLLLAGRLRNEELADGLINLVTFPMIILSGVFFSLEGTPEVLQRASLALPLTHYVSGARAVMLEGAGVGEVLPHVLALAAMAVVFWISAAAIFRWE